MKDKIAEQLAEFMDSTQAQQVSALARMAATLITLNSPTQQPGEGNVTPIEAHRAPPEDSPPAA